MKTLYFADALGFHMQPLTACASDSANEHTFMCTLQILCMYVCINNTACKPTTVCTTYHSQLAKLFECPLYYYNNNYYTYCTTFCLCL